MVNVEDGFDDEGRENIVGRMVYWKFIGGWFMFVEILLFGKVGDFWVKIVGDVLVVWVVWVEVGLFGEEVVDVLVKVEVWLILGGTVDFVEIGLFWEFMIFGGKIVVWIGILGWVSGVGIGLFRGVVDFLGWYVMILGCIFVFVKNKIVGKVVVFWVKIVWGVFVVRVIFVEMSLFGDVGEVLFIVEV